MRLDSSGRMGLGLLNPHSYYANQLVIKCPSEGGMTLRNTGANDWNYIMFASGDSSSTRYSGWIGYDHADNKLKVAVNDDVSGKGFGFLRVKGLTRLPKPAARIIAFLIILFVTNIRNE